MGVDGVLVEEFTAEFASTDPVSFLEKLVKKLQAQGVVAGFNYSFGAGGYGNAALIRAEAERLNYLCDIVDPVMEEGEAVSSTLIRRLLSRGDEERAAGLLKLR